MFAAKGTANSGLQMLVISTQDSKNVSIVSRMYWAAVALPPQTLTYKNADEGAGRGGQSPPVKSFAQSLCLQCLSSRTEADASGEAQAGRVSNLSHEVGRQGVSSA